MFRALLVTTGRARTRGKNGFALVVMEILAR